MLFALPCMIRAYPQCSVVCPTRGLTYGCLFIQTAKAREPCGHWLQFSVRGDLLDQVFKWHTRPLIQFWKYYFYSNNNTNTHCGWAAHLRPGPPNQLSFLLTIK